MSAIDMEVLAMLHRRSTALLVLLSIAPASAQVSWTKRPLLERSLAPVAFDSARGRLVLVTTPSASPTVETWEWDGAVWTRRDSATRPPAQFSPALAYDTARQRVVLFGGAEPTPQNTWEWDGNDWMLHSPPTGPSERRGHAMAYDAARQRVVLFGGTFNILKTVFHYNDTWEWDGTSWTRRTPATSPPTRAHHGLAYDVARGNVVLFGGSNSAGALADTWTFDGTTWTQRAPASSPSARSELGMAYDATLARVVLFGGNGGGALADTWEWDGTAWTQRTPPLAPVARIRPSLAYDGARGVTLAFGGREQSFLPLGDLWQWNGSAWSQLAAPDAIPLPRHSHAAVYDASRGRTIVFGGQGPSNVLADHWEWDGARWTELVGGARPSARSRHAMAYDRVRARTVLFGGELPGFADDTWEFDGTAWSARTLASRPSARIDHAMAFDELRARTVLFGGLGIGGRTNDTWEWNGTTWTLRQPASRPSARNDHAMAYDRSRGTVLLFGGAGNGFGALFADTWEWNGTNWTQRSPVTSPPPRADHALAFDDARGRVVLYGGGFGVLSDTWEWTGDNWIQRAPLRAPDPRSRHALAHDEARSKVVLFGGQSTGANYADTWEYGPDVAASFVRFGTGCAGSAGVPVLDAAPLLRPWIGERFTLRVSSLPAASSAIVGFGISSAQWGSIALPLDLGPAGAFGCTLYASLDALAVATGAGGIASLDVLIPAQSAFVGTSVHCQSLVLDPPANAAGVVLANAGTAHVGAK